MDGVLGAAETLVAVGTAAQHRSGSGWDSADAVAVVATPRAQAAAANSTATADLPANTGESFTVPSY